MLARLKEKWLEHGSLDREMAIRIAKDMMVNRANQDDA